MDTASFQVAVLYYGDPTSRSQAAADNSKVPTVFPALKSVGIHGVPVVYHDDVRDAVRNELLRMDGVLVWYNPIEGGRDRRVLDAMLREVVAAGIFVSTHPDVILQLGTKQVLVDTLSMSWSARGTAALLKVEDLQGALAAHRATGATRVFKQYRGHSGQGIWKMQPAGNQFRVREALRGSAEQVLSLNEFVDRCAPYFLNGGRMIDQPYQSRLPEGMIRCYLVHDEVQGFGHQAVNALCPAPAEGPVDAFPATTPRLYYPRDTARFQALKWQLESQWLPQLQSIFTLKREQLPVLWDCDFLLGAPTLSGEDSYVLCEINVSSVSPFPESAVMPLAQACLARVSAATS